MVKIIMSSNMIKIKCLTFLDFLQNHQNQVFLKYCTELILVSWISMSAKFTVFVLQFFELNNNLTYNLWCVYLEKHSIILLHVLQLLIAQKFFLLFLFV